MSQIGMIWDLRYEHEAWKGEACQELYPSQQEIPSVGEKVDLGQEREVGHLNFTTYPVPRDSTQSLRLVAIVLAFRLKIATTTTAIPKHTT